MFTGSITIMPKGIKTKPYFESTDKKFKLYLDDCRDFLNNVPEESVDMIFADPPYNLSNGGFTCHAGKMVSVNKGDWDQSKGLDEDLKFHIEWIGACRRVLKPGGTIWISGTYHSIYRCGYALELAGYHILNDIAWFKPNASPNLSCRFFTASHETLIWARKEKKAKHTFNYKEMVEWKNNYKKTFKNEKASAYHEHEILHEKGKQMRSVWAINTPKPVEKRFGKHPTQKPEELLRRIVAASTNKGDLIIDPFTGSSTTGIMTYYLKRRFIGVDNDKNYLDKSKKRFEYLKANLDRKHSKNRELILK
jgi:site-specific DNA-methyltransferase (adenine-specific)